jgi:hypothetical protein
VGNGRNDETSQQQRHGDSQRVDEPDVVAQMAQQKKGD